MVTFLIAVVALICGYFLYGYFIERVFGIDTKRKTPAITKADGVDYIEMPTWKIFMIQFLNIAGLGPIFGAIMGAKFGVSSYLWIVLGCIFAGATHDFLSGMISLRNGGESLPETIGRYLGKNVKAVFLVITVLLLILVVAVFVSGPAAILHGMFSAVSLPIWIIIIFAYYILATLLPVDKIIGKVYPLFAGALLFMAFGILIMIIVRQPQLPEIWDGLANTHPNKSSVPVFPMMFITIACGAISGFHATQSPLMARCIKNEKHGRPIFYGAMICEGVVALIWAAAAMYFYGEHGMAESNSAVIAKQITEDWLGTLGGALAILGIVAAPISTGDTALRSARLIVADCLHYKQKKIFNRLVICIPIALLSIGCLLMSMFYKEGWSIIWRYFSWTNQLLSVFTLWAVTSYLMQAKKLYYVTLIPALFMTVVCTSYICIAPEGLRLSSTLSYSIGVALSLLLFGIFLRFKNKMKDKPALEI